jgi:hypothetical protein
VKVAADESKSGGKTTFASREKLREVGCSAPISPVWNGSPGCLIVLCYRVKSRGRQLQFVVQAYSLKSRYGSSNSALSEVTIGTLTSPSDECALDVSLHPFEIVPSAQKLRRRRSPRLRRKSTAPPVRTPALDQRGVGRVEVDAVRPARGHVAAAY